MWVRARVRESARALSTTGLPPSERVFVFPTELKNDKIYTEHEFQLYRSDGTPFTVKGLWGLFDNGYFEWRCCQCPISTPLNMDQHNFSIHMLKMKFSCLKHPIVLHDLDQIQDMVHACCILWNLQRSCEEELELADSEFWEEREGEEIDETDEEGDDGDEGEQSRKAHRLHVRKMKHFFDRDLRGVSREASAAARGCNFVGPIPWGVPLQAMPAEKTRFAELRSMLVEDDTYRKSRNLIMRISPKKRRLRERARVEMLLEDGV